MKKPSIFLLIVFAFVGTFALFADGLNERYRPRTPKTGKVLPLQRTPDWVPKLISTEKTVFPKIYSDRMALSIDKPMQIMMPQKMSASGSVIQGLRAVSTDPEFSEKSWYELNTDGSQTKLWYSEAMVETIGFVKEEEIWMFYFSEFWGTIWSAYDIYDINTGELIGEGDLDSSNYSNVVLSIVYDEGEDVAYAYTYNNDMSGALLQKFDLETKTFTVLNSDEDLVDKRMVTWAFNPKDNGIYGIDLYGDLMRMDKTNGNFVRVASTGVVPGSFSQSMVYSPLDKAFIWAAILPDQTSCIYEIDPVSANTTLLHRFDYVNQYTILCTPDKLCADNAPGLVNFTGIKFDGASLTGEGTIVLPTTYYNGDALTADINVKVKIDGVTKINDLVGKPGEELTFEYTFTEGLHEVTVIPFFKDGYNEIEGHPVVRNAFAGNDTPCTPQNIVFTETLVKWDAVGGIGTNGGYVDQQALGYNVYVNGELQNTELIKDTQLEIVIPDGNFAFYEAEVEAVANGKVSERGNSGEKIFGHAFTIPFSMQPTETDCKLMTFIDKSDENQGYWRYDNDEQGLTHITVRNYDADDWVFLPLINFEESLSLYEISFDARARLANFPESFEVVVSKTTNPEDAQVIYSETINNTSYKTIKSVFQIDESGEYYIGFHCTSQKNMFYLYIRNINIVMTAKVSDCPGKVDYLTASPLPLGELKADISFKMPQKTIGGDSLYAHGQALTATVTTGIETVTVTGEPGSTQNVQLATVQGVNTVTVYVSNSYGAGEETSINVYTGIDIPEITDVNASVSSDNMTMTLNWTMPETGANGGYIDPESLSYTIYRVNSYDQWETIDVVKNTNSYEYSARKNKGLQYERLGVTAANSYGKTEEIIFASAVIGTPYELPMVEKFVGQLAYEPIVEQLLGDNYTATWTFYDPSQIDGAAATESGNALIGYPQTWNEAYGRIALPKFTTKDLTNVEVAVDLFVADFMPETEIIVCGHDEEVVLGKIDRYSKEKGWHTFKYTLPEQFQNRAWAYVAIRGHYDGTTQYLIIGSYAVKNLYANDVAVASIQGPKATVIGKTETYKATIQNMGYEAIDMPEVNCVLVDSKGNVLKTVYPAGEPDMATLQPDEAVEFEYEYISEANHLGNVALRVSFTNDDADQTNNTLDYDIKVNPSTDPIVTDLEATINDEKTAVTLDWSVPVLSVELDDMEGLTAFSYGLELGNWTNIDGDEKIVWIFQNWEYPDMGTPKAFHVFNYSQASYGGAAFEPYSGNQYLLAICPDDEVTKADDWLISPEIKGGSGISFYMNIINAKYSPETVEIMYSSTTPDRESFSVVETISKSTTGWEMVSVILPEDAKYFAIHYISMNMFGIMIDDISYAPVDSTAEIAGYNVYRDGKKIAEKVADNSYVDNTVDSETDYVYNVTVVVSSEGVETEYAMSNSAMANLSGINDLYTSKAVYATDGAIVIKGYAGNDALICTPDGKIVARQRIDADTVIIPVETNIYIINVGNAVRKLIVK